MKDYPETHQQGTISIENAVEVFGQLSQNNYIGDFGVQISRDGRVWICVNGIAFIRFKPVSGDVGGNTLHEKNQRAWEGWPGR